MSARTRLTAVPASAKPLPPFKVPLAQIDASLIDPASSVPLVLVEALECILGADTSSADVFDCSGPSLEALRTLLFTPHAHGSDAAPPSGLASLRMLPSTPRSRTHSLHTPHTHTHTHIRTGWFRPKRQLSPDFVTRCRLA